VPADPEFRSIASEMIGRYVDIVGGSEADRLAFEAALTRAVDSMCTKPHGDVELSCVPLESGFEIKLTCNGQTSVVRHPLTAEKH
jgi:hypothetical protein